MGASNRVKSVDKGCVYVELGLCCRNVEKQGAEDADVETWIDAALGFTNINMHIYQLDAQNRSPRSMLSRFQLGSVRPVCFKLASLSELLRYLMAIAGLEIV